jgi:ABC-type Na+ efflux pump permease subunit
MATALVKETPNVPSGALAHPAELKADEDSQETVSTFLKVDDDVSEIAAKPIRSQEEASGATRSSSEDSEAYVTTHLKIDVELSSTVYKEDTKGPGTLPAANTSLGHRAPQTQPRDRKRLILVVVGVVMVAAASVVVLGAWSH